MRLGLVAVLALLSGVAHAGRRPLEYLVELGNGISVPLGGDTYTRVADPGYKASLRFALDIPVVAELRLGPCVQLDGSPVNSDDASFEKLGLDARFGRFRFLVGADARYRVIPRLDVWLRVSIGGDYAAGSVKFVVGPATSYASTVFAFEPAVGVTVQIWRMLVGGLGVAFPLAVNHKFGAATPFNAADLDLTLLFGARF